MSITVNSVSAASANPAPGSQDVITPSLSDPANTATITVQADGSKASVQVTITEPETFSVNPADVGKPGMVVATVDQGGTLSVGPAGTFIFTAS